jgi:hypothetical protein
MAEILPRGENEHEQEEMDADITEIERPEEEKTEAMQCRTLPDKIHKGHRGGGNN